MAKKEELTSFLVRLWPKQADAIRRAAAKKGLSLSEFIRSAIVRAASNIVSVPSCDKIEHGWMHAHAARDAEKAPKPKKKTAKKKTAQPAASKSASAKPKRSHHKKPVAVTPIEEKVAS